MNPPPEILVVCNAHKRDASNAERQAAKQSLSLTDSILTGSTASHARYRL
jgi:hypothetical protein